MTFLWSASDATSDIIYDFTLTAKVPGLIGVEIGQIRVWDESGTNEPIAQGEGFSNVFLDCFSFYSPYHID